MRRSPKSRRLPTIDPDWTYTSPGPAKCVEIGNVYLHKGNLKGALSRFEEAVKDNSNYAPAYLGLGKVYERMNEKQKALDAFKRYLDELPSAKEAAEAQRCATRHCPSAKGTGAKPSVARAKLYGKSMINSCPRGSPWMMTQR